MITMDIGTIALILGMIGSVLGIFKQITDMKRNQEDMIRQQVEQQKAIDMRLEALEKSVATHNQYAERFASLTEAIVAMKTDLNWIKSSMEK